MNDEISISVDIPTDENGLLGRECLKCEKYFKLKPGTGLPTNHCHCPYCDYEGDADTFWTPAQIEYAQSIAVNQIVDQFLKPSLDKLRKSFKDLERKTRNSFIQFKVTKNTINLKLPVKYYNELELETHVICDSCGLEFAVYGVFARCPDCTNLNAFLIFIKSIETAEKKLAIFLKPEVPEEIRNDSYKHIISDCISAFDALGKELRSKKPNIFPTRPRNLFQNLYLLNDGINNFISSQHSNFDFLLKMFQVRHLYEHNMGVVDKDFAEKIPNSLHMIGKKYVIDRLEIEKFIENIYEIRPIIQEYFENAENLNRM